MADFAEIRKLAKRPEDVVRLCLAGDLVAEHELLDTELRSLRTNPDAGIEGDGRADLVDQILYLQDRMRGAEYPFRLRALKRGEYKALKNDALPRRDSATGEVDERDAQRGFDIDRLYELLVPASIIDPGPSPELDETLAELTDGQFAQLGNAAFYLNEGQISVPFSRAASLLTGSTGGE